MVTPDRQPQRADGKAVCPFTDAPLDDAHEYYATFKTIIEHSTRIAAQTRR